MYNKLHYKSADFTHQNFILLWYLTWLAAFSCGFRSSLEKSCHTWKSQPDLIFCSNIRARVTTPLNWPSHTKFSTTKLSTIKGFFFPALAFFLRVSWSIQDLKLRSLGKSFLSFDRHPTTPRSTTFESL